MSEIEIRPLRRSDLKRISQFHRQMFAHSRSTELGDLFVRKMYRWFLEKQDDLAIVASVEGKPVGVVTGAIGGYGRKITRYAAPQIAWCLVTQPKLVFNKKTFNAWQSYIQAFRPNYGNAPAPPAENETPKVRASLASIAVASEFGGRGIGAKLMQAFEDAARQRGANQLGLSVEADNKIARRLYEKSGWRVLHENENEAYYVKDLN